MPDWLQGLLNSSKSTPSYASTWDSNNTFDPIDMHSMQSVAPAQGVTVPQLDVGKSSWLDTLLKPVGGLSGAKDIAGGIGSLGQAWLANQSVDMMRDQLNNTKAYSAANLHNTSQAFNSALDDKARYQASVYSGSNDPSSSAYKDYYNNYNNQYKAKSTV